MRGRGLLAAFLLGVGLCFVPVMGYGQAGQYENKTKVYLSPEEVHSLLVNAGLQRARIDYIMRNPTNFLNVDFYYDQEGMFTNRGLFPEGVDTKDKVVVIVVDNRGIFSGKSGGILLNEFEKQLETIIDSSAVLQMWARVPEFLKKQMKKELGIEMDLDTHIVARFCTKWKLRIPYALPEEVCLGYFYQGEYHLWER